MNETIRLIAI